MSEGTLYLVATPIGNLGDMSARAIETLRSVDFIASEDTRKTGILLKHFGIKQRQISFHEHNERRKTERIVNMLLSGQNAAVVSNAGTPAISDPGYRLVRACIDAQIEVTMIPGAAAFVMAVVLSGLAADSFVFRGFAPRKSGKRQTFLAVDKDSPHTLVFYESPYRVKKFLTDALEVYGDRKAAVAKELTKKFETIHRGRISELLDQLDEKLKGEYVIVIEGKTSD